MFLAVLAQDADLERLWSTVGACGRAEATNVSEAFKAERNSTPRRPINISNKKKKMKTHVTSEAHDILQL